MSVKDLTSVLSILRPCHTAKPPVQARYSLNFWKCFLGSEGFTTLHAYLLPPTALLHPKRPPEKSVSGPIPRTSVPTHHKGIFAQAPSFQAEFLALIEVKEHDRPLWQVVVAVRSWAYVCWCKTGFGFHSPNP